MKSLFLAGGFAGFTLCALAGLVAGRAPDLILRDAAIGCLAGALLLRWFWRVLLGGFQDTLRARRRAAEDAAAAAQQTNPPPKNGQPQKAAQPAVATATAPAPRAMPFAPPKPATR
jgi:hypothetical protein